MRYALKFLEKDQYIMQFSIGQTYSNYSYKISKLAYKIFDLNKPLMQCPVNRYNSELCYLLHQ